MPQARGYTRSKVATRDRGQALLQPPRVTPSHPSAQTGHAHALPSVQHLIPLSTKPSNKSQNLGK